MPKWIAGESIDIPGHGTATISFVGEDSVGLTWADGRDALFRVDHLEALLAGGKAAEANAGAEPGVGLPWPEDTFVADDTPERHAPGSYGQPLAERAADDGAPTLPAAQQRHFAALAGALRDVTAELDKQVEVASRDWEPGAFHERVQALLARETAAIEQLTAAVNGPLARVAAGPSTPVAALHRMAGRILEAASQLQRLQCEAQAVPATDDEIDARALLVATFARPVREFRAWLDEVIEALADPIAAARKRGLEGPEIELPLSLKLTAAPETTRLTAWFARRSCRVVDDCDECNWDGWDDCEPDADAVPDRPRWWQVLGLGALAAWLMAWLTG